MQTYSVFWVGDAGEVLATSSTIEAIDDAAAERQAITLAEGDHVELWQGMRMVLRINPKPMPKLGESQT